MDDIVHVYEFVLSVREELKPGKSYDYDVKKKKEITAVQLTENDKVKRIYAMKIDDLMNFVFEINKYQNKSIIFNKLITKIVHKDKINHTELISNEMKTSIYLFSFINFEEIFLTKKVFHFKTVL